MARDHLTQIAIYPLNCGNYHRSSVNSNLAISLLRRAGYHNIAEGRRAAAWNHNGLALNILGL